MSTNKPPKPEEIPNQNDSETSEESGEEGPQTPTDKVPTTGCKEILETEIASMMKNSAIKSASTLKTHDKNTLWLESATNPVTRLKLYLLYEHCIIPFDKIHVPGKFENLWEIREKVENDEFETYEMKPGTFLNKEDPDFNHMHTKCEVELEYATKSGWKLPKRKFTVIYAMEYKLSEWEVEDEEKGLLRMVTKVHSAE